MIARANTWREERPMAEAFMVDACYTNEEITEGLGGIPLTYIRFVAPKRVVALCLNAWEHPRAPGEVWIGSGGPWNRVSRSAQWLVEQCEADPQLGLPLFIKGVAAQGGERSWCYHGRYRVSGD